MKPDLLILGAGPAGLAAAYAAKQKGRSSIVAEASASTGGLCKTLSCDRFRYDSGAHRFHDRDRFSTELVTSWLGQRLKLVQRPSVIHENGRSLHFPLAAHQLALHLGFAGSLRAGFDLARSRLASPPIQASFQDAAIRAYGRLLAERYLLNYSSKLWGRPCHTLCPSIAGKRLKGLNMRHTFGRLLPGARQDSHLEGRFYYPTGGIGAITDHMADGAAIHLNARVTRVCHDGERVLRVETADGRVLDAENFISSIRLDHLVGALDPAIPEMTQHAQHLAFRGVVLIVLMLRQPTVSEAATTYFPSADVIFGRAYEPRNRCQTMAPVGETSLCFEIACDEGDAVWNAEEDVVLACVKRNLAEIGWAVEPSITAAAVHRLPAAYPVLTLDALSHAASLLDQLKRLANLRVIGRNGRYHYAWIHDMLREGHQAVAELSGEEATCGPC